MQALSRLIQPPAAPPSRGREGVSQDAPALKIEEPSERPGRQAQLGQPGGDTPRFADTEPNETERQRPRGTFLDISV